MFDVTGTKVGTLSAGKALPPNEVMDLLNAGGWHISGGSGVQKQLVDQPILQSMLAEDGSMHVFSGQSLRLATDFRFVLGDVFVRESAYRLQVRRFTPQLCDRPKSEGGGKHTRMLPTIFLSLYNKELERRHIEAKEAERQAQLDAERLQREQFITELGLTGCQIFGIGETVHGPVIRLTDGRELFLGGRLRDLRVRRPETPNSLT